MSLFSKLQRLYRADRFLLEDFHTEIVAQALRNSPALTLAWLRAVGATELKAADHIDVKTQEEFAPLPSHLCASKPDIAIRLVGQGGTELVLIESKLPATQGYGQLQRYAEHLHAMGEGGAITRASLVFVTRDYEAADSPQTAKSTFEITFRRTRWFEFYRHLKAHANGDGLVKELMLFMQKNQMSLGNQFRSTDVVALESFLSAKALMDETLQGEVTDAVWKVHGNVRGINKASNELRDHHRYVLSSWSNDSSCLVGYWLPHENPDESVLVGVHLYSVPGSPIRSQVIEAFRDWVKHQDSWSAVNLDDIQAWSCLTKVQPIQALMGQTDHVRAVKNFLVDVMKEVEAFRASYPTLQWGNAVNSAAEPEK